MALVSIEFPSFADGRGFSLARGLRRRGYRGILRAFGPLIADQMRHALGCGFGEVETSETVIARQPISQWSAALQAITLHGHPDPPQPPAASADAMSETSDAPRRTRAWRSHSAIVTHG